ncbi:hypothetical protein ACFWNQ_15195 [Streptomyces virginiae]|uniref:hypothetical protein n=1 Tax=Streptomyces virginiae TaxID=1961 RepID=UPI00365A2232
MTTNTTTALAQLDLIAAHWTDLHQLRTARPHDAWPPASLQAYLRTVEEYDPSDRSAPVRLHVIDTIRTVELVLIPLADHIASRIQRPVINAATGKGWSDDLHRQAALLSARDSADPTRWQYTGTRTGQHAAQWLAARLRQQPGPFRPLNLREVEEIQHIAAGAAERVEHALGIRRRTVGTGHICGCGGELFLEGGDGRPPTLVCDACARSLTLADAAA